MDPDGEDAIVAVKKLSNGVTQITLSSTIRVGKDVTDAQIKGMQASLNSYLNGDYSVNVGDGEFAGKYEIVFDVNIERFEDGNNEIGPGENVFEVKNIVSGVAHSQGEVINPNKVTGAADVLMEIGNTVTIATQNANALSSEAAHEFLHLVGLADRYKAGKGIDLPHKGYADDVMGYPNTGLSNTKQLEGLVNTIMQELKSGGVLTKGHQVLNKDVEDMGIYLEKSFKRTVKPHGPVNGALRILGSKVFNIFKSAPVREAYRSVRFL